MVAQKHKIVTVALIIVLVLAVEILVYNLAYATGLIPEGGLVLLRYTLIILTPIVVVIVSKPIVKNSRNPQDDSEKC